LWIQVFRGVVRICFKRESKWCKTSRQCWRLVCPFFNI